MAAAPKKDKAGTAVPVATTAAAPVVASPPKYTGPELVSPQTALLDQLPRVWKKFMEEKHNGGWSAPQIRAYMLDHYDGEIKIPVVKGFNRYFAKLDAAANAADQFPRGGRGGKKGVNANAIAMRREGHRTELELQEKLDSYRLSDMDFGNHKDLLDSILRSAFTNMEYLEKINRSQMDPRYAAIISNYYTIAGGFVKDLQALALIGQWNECTAMLIVKKYYDELATVIKKATDKILGAADARGHQVIDEIRRGSAFIDFQKIVDVATAEVAAMQKNGQQPPSNAFTASTHTSTAVPPRRLGPNSR